MKKLWTYIEGKNWKAATKYRFALLTAQTISALAGLAVWLMIRSWALSTLDWMICLIGYPAALSWLVVFFYACRHDFHDGNGRRS